MKRISSFISRLPFLTIIIPLLAYVCLVYGLLANKLGFYWDDWAYIWTRIELGFHGLLRHFSFSRPVAGQLHNIAILLTNASPLRVQLYGMLMQISGSLMLGLLIEKVWHNGKLAAAMATFLFISYPGFNMQPIAINFSFSYFLIGILSISYLLSIMAGRNKKRRILYTAIAMSLAALNLFASEYFFLLELLRPFFIWCEFISTETTLKERLRQTVRWELPYIFVFMAGMLYRLFFNKTQTLHYEFSLVEEFKVSPFQAIGSWFLRMLGDCWSVVAKAWATVFIFPDIKQLGTRSFGLYCLICVVCALIIFIFLFLLNRHTHPKYEPLGLPQQLIIIGLVCLVLAGQPFWLTGSELSFIFPNSRYTLPFMPGTAFILAGLLSLIRRPSWLPIMLCSILVGLAAGGHFISANEYRRDWTLTRDFFWQLKWRVPEIKENTVVVTNVLPIRFSTDNSLTAPLNWIYADEYQSDLIPYMLYTNTKREKALSGIKSDHEVFQEYLSAQFFGNTNDMLSLYYNAPGCVHVLDPEVDIFNQTIPEIDREAAILNNYSRILSESEQTPLPASIFGEEPSHGWCWYYEKADLSRQNADWQQVAELGDKAFALNDHPNDPMERIPFIEGYANVGRWQDAAEQTLTALAVTPVMNDPLCALWDRIQHETPNLGDKAEAVDQIFQTLQCQFLEE